jgi:hypothetical protein
MSREVEIDRQALTLQKALAQVTAAPGSFEVPADLGQNPPPSNDSPSSSPPSSGGGGSSVDAFFADKVKAQKFSMFQSVYTALWGEPATEDYLKAAVNAGLNQHEFNMRERRKPAFVKTEAYRNQASELAEIVNQVG